LEEVAAWPSIDQCADRLAWSNLSLESSLSDILSRLSDPPFTEQQNHGAHVKGLIEQLNRLKAKLEPSVFRTAAEQCRRAVEAAPDDHVLQSRLAYLLGQSGDLEGAHEAAVKARDLLPHNASKWSQLGLVLGTQKRDQEAIEAFSKALELSPDDIFLRHELAKVLLRIDRQEEALDQLRRAVATNSSFGPAYLTMGLIYDQRKETTAADTSFRNAVKHRVKRLADLTAIAKVCQTKGWYDDAIACFEDALRVSPADAGVHLNLAQCLDQVGRKAEAEQHFLQGVSLAPGFAQGRYLFGVHLAKRDEHARAAEQFRAAAELDPSFLTARVDYAMALIALDRLREALAQFNEVLAREPTHATALEYKAAIEKELGMQPKS
jgi:tetratricopeptide (TPR) repeat protein